MVVTGHAHSGGVIPRGTVPQPVVALLRAQRQVITREQALSLGAGRKLIERLLREGHWRRLDRGLFVAGTAPLSLEQRAWAGHLSAGPASAVGGAAALCLLGALREPASGVQVVVPPHSSPRLPAGYTLLRDGLGRLGHARGSLRLVRAEDALLDLAPQLTLEQFVGAVTDCTGHRVTTVARVASVLRGRPRMRNRAELKEVLADLQGIESNLEFVYRRDVERAHGLPTGIRQAPTHGRQRIDVLYEEYRLIAELDGKLGHVEGRFRDFRRDNEHAVGLLNTLRFGSFDVRAHPCEIAQMLGRAFELRGWGGGPAVCPRCQVRRVA